MTTFQSYTFGTAFGLLMTGMSLAETGALVGKRSVIPVEQREVLSGRLSLREAVLTALELNPEIEIQREQQVATELQLDVARAEFDPVLSADSAGRYRREPRASSELDGAVQPESDGVTASMGVEKKLGTGASVGLDWQPLNRSATNSTFSTLNPSFSSELSLNVRQPLLKGGWGVNQIPTELAMVNVTSGKYQTMQVVIDTLRDVEVSYWQAGAAANELEIRAQAVELAKVILEETMARDTSRVDELEAKSNLLEREAALVDAQKQLDDATDNLLRVLGVLGEMEPGDLALQKVRVPADVEQLIDPEKRYAQALETSPRIAIQRARIDQAELEVERARYDVRPTLDLTASVGVSGRDADMRGAWSGAANQDGRAANAGIEFRIPWGSRAERAREASAESDLKRERLQVHAERLDLFGDVREACRAVEAALKRLAAADAAVEVNEVRFEEQQIRRRNGDSSLRALLEAQNDLDGSRLGQLQARVEVLTSLARLRALDGQLPETLGVVLVDGKAVEDVPEDQRS
ncbi:TolC family protein [Sulfuriroseicoccus oceanibius]|uniref:TolC family protein n=1 Tax=Sulfuriroseicoccus oceanibius TaxID=2707525 RepID=A0A7T7F0C0_9BACT|nr:TolC family protein [Sulfuriroseicoccus oceanibius]QQL44496.1 TolC family protein [Sulfuriroseicoccus oceanibius]